MNKPTIFISYSHKEVEWKNRLETHLRGLQLQDRLDFWSDEKIRGGDAWLEKIQAAMDAASVAVLLVSADFLASEFIHREEVKRLLERRAKEKLPLLPILVRPCLWKGVPWLAQMQMRPRNAIPLSAGTSHEIDVHLTAIVEEIDRMFERGTTREESGRAISVPLERGSVSESSPTTFRNSIGMEFILIPAGEFRMGAKNGDTDEKPVHRVQISQPFYLGKYPVTQAQWQTVMGDNPSGFTGDLNRPVETVSWEEAQTFLRKLSEREGGKPYRLPTEAEWEYAARAGTTTAYCFGDEPKLLSEYAWFSENSGDTTHPVGQRKPNAWGLDDVHGNVWEWVSDWFAEDYYRQRPNPDRDPQGPNTGDCRVLRGGSWRSVARNIRVAVRDWLEPGSRSRRGSLGFRCAQ